METYSPKTRSTQIFVQELPDELVVYDVERNEVHCLNGSAARVWTLCDGTNTVAEIARLLGSDLEPHAAETLVWMALDQFAEKHLLDEPTLPGWNPDNPRLWREPAQHGFLAGVGRHREESPRDDQDDEDERREDPHRRRNSEEDVALEPPVGVRNGFLPE